MTGLRRTICIVAALAAFQASPWISSARADEVQDTFKQGVELLQRGRRTEALVVFKKLLGMGPTQQQAYGLWQSTDAATWTDLLVEGGDFELVAKRLMQLSMAERTAHKADKEAILALVKTATDVENPPLERSRAIRTLATEHGDYAAAALVGFLGSEGQEDRRVLAMHALIQLGHDVVVPLMAALHSEDAVQRRNLTLVLGTIGDARSTGGLQLLAAQDADESVKKAAAEGLARMHAEGDAQLSFLRAGDDYYHRRDSVLSDDMWSDVLWSWKDRALVATPVPHELYPAEMSKISYLHALHLDPASNEALAGLARAWCDEQQKLARAEKAGKDVGEWKSKSDQALTAIHAAGVDALDLALSWSVKSDDSSTGSALCRVLGPLAPAATPGLNQALASTDGAIRSEAAVALAQVTLRGSGPADANVVNLLAEAIGREVVRVALVIDADAARSAMVASGLEKSGIFVTQMKSGALGLLQAHRASGLDVVLLADSLPDMTSAQVLDELRADEALAAVPVIMLAANAEEATATYGDRIKGAMTGGEDLKLVQEAMGKELTGDRALAEDLAGRAAHALNQLCHAGRCMCDTNVLAAVGAALNNRPDSVVVPTLSVLSSCGGPDHTAAITAILANEARSEEVRRAAGLALAGILGRNASALSPEALAQVQAVALSAAPVSVREAASRALALAQMDAAARAKLQQQLQLGAAH